MLWVWFAAASGSALCAAARHTHPGVESTDEKREVTCAGTLVSAYV